MSARLAWLSPLLFPLALGCSSASAHHDPATPSGDHDAELAKVAAIHGGAGPWVVAGYRMGEHALVVLKLARQSFDLEVIHHSPHEVQLSCIADGAAAATGASVGKLNLSLEETDAAHTATTYRKKSTGESITLRPTAAFAARFKDVPRAELGSPGRVVIGLGDDEIFEEVK